MNDSHEADAIIVGAGIAGLVATYELTQAGKSVLLLDQDNVRNSIKRLLCAYHRHDRRRIAMRKPRWLGAN